MPPRQTLRTVPLLWLLSDLRTDAALDAALRRLPRGSGLIFRHYHLPPAERIKRFRALARLGRQRGLLAVWAGAARAARAAGADGCYGSPAAAGPGPDLLRLVTVHSLRELAAAGRARADAVLVSPVFPTRSHPGARGLGPVRWLLLARRSPVPPIALGGVDRHRVRRLGGQGWAAIDGLAAAAKGPGIPMDS